MIPARSSVPARLVAVGHMAIKECRHGTMMYNVNDAFIGRYWKKHGARSLLDDAFHIIAQGPALRVLGAVTLILRGETH